MGERAWARPWQSRCKARLHRDAGLGYWGRCDLRRDHSGPHALERGMEVVEWPPPAEVAARLAREFEAAREIVARRTRMPAYLASDEDWEAALAEAQATLPPPPEPMTGLQFAIRKAHGGPLHSDSRDDVEAYHAALRLESAPAPSTQEGDGR